jgi:pimeloyl-ACP methyl ester carboxylesterase
MAAPLMIGASTRPAPLRAPVGSQAGEMSPWTPCTYQPVGSDKTYAAECATLTVAENWDDPASRLIAVPVVRVRASGPDPDAPVFWLEGGPGQSNLGYEPPDWILSRHDLVLIGYRGVDGSVRLDCPEVVGAFQPHLGKGLFSETFYRQGAQAARQCAARLEAEGVDLAGYTIAGVVADMEAARRAMGYERINLLAVSYGTRVAQIYAYLHPDSLKRAILIGVNTPGHFIWKASALDERFHYLATVCAEDPACRARTPDLAETIRRVNATMPDQWLTLPIDRGTVRTALHAMLFSIDSMPIILDAYLAADAGDPSGLAALTLLARVAVPLDQIVFGDFFNKGGTADLDLYNGEESIALDDSLMGAPLSELLWPLAEAWSVTLIAPELRQLQATDAEMLLVNGTLDFSTLPVALDEARPFYRRAQFVLLADLGHVGDVMNRQPAAFERLVISYYDTGQADASGYRPERPAFGQPSMSLPFLTKAALGGLVGLPLLAALGVVWWWRRRR